MKANAPEKIYLDPVKMAETESVVLSIVPDFRVEDNDIEYTRTDAFIEKAAEWLKLYILNNDTIDIFEMEEQFKNYMK